MKKSLAGILILTMLCTALSFPAFGQKNVLKSKEINQYSSSVMKEPRGRVISTGVLQISNVGNGEIGAFIQTLTHTDVDETIFTVYLDRWIESEKRWADIDNYTFRFSKEDYPDEDLSMKSVSFNIIGQPTDCYYRLRGTHLVISGDIRESLSNETDGILITK